MFFLTYIWIFFNLPSQTHKIEYMLHKYNFFNPKQDILSLLYERTRKIDYRTTIENNVN